VIEMEKIYARSTVLSAAGTRYCPGCMHGLISKMIAELVEEFQIQDRVVGIMPVGCGAMSKNVFNFDVVCAAHGRAPAVATGFNRSAPDRIVFTYQGDGDLAAIGTSEIVHAAARGEKITVIFINNTIYGMTAGQMAPTTLLNQYSTTTPYGRIADLHGFPIKVSEMLATLEGPAYIERASLQDVKHIKKAKEAVKKAFKVQMAGLGFAMVELLSTCPTNWGLSPVEALNRIRDEVVPHYPLGVLKGENLEV
jgi:2-oxoglutarate ferredoxin oxidoreductase subunit beta